jgi:hypothetical protein
MTPLFAARQRLVDRLAIAAVAGAVIAVVALLASTSLPSESEWQRLIGATMLASPAPPVDPSSPTAGTDRQPSVL